MRNIKRRIINPIYRNINKNETYPESIYSLPDFPKGLRQGYFLIVTKIDKKTYYACIDSRDYR
jgi:hypothetical protein